MSTPAVAQFAYGDERTVSQVLSVSLATLRRWRASGDGPGFVRFGKSVRYLLSDVESWAASKRAGK